jgi:hypothetical protein
MYFSHLFPPGRVWWAVRDEALHPSHQRSEGDGTGLRLYEVQQVEEVFRQIEFKGDMLRYVGYIIRLGERLIHSTGWMLAVHIYRINTTAFWPSSKLNAAVHTQLIIAALHFRSVYRHHHKL